MKSLRALVAALVVGVGLPVAGAVTGPCTAAAAAQDVSRAGLVVQFDDASVEEFCVSFTEDAISGLDLLERSGLAVVYEDFGAMGAAVCRIGDVGCDHPREPCFCRCADPGGECVLWGYYLIEGGGWTFSQDGPSQRMVRDGDVDGWRFGAQSPEGGATPRAADLEGVCARGTPVGADVGFPETEREPLPTVAVVATFVALGALALWGLGRARRRQGEES